MNIIILPGNPPSRYHYELWIKELKQSLPHDNFFYLEYTPPNLGRAPEQELKKMLQITHEQILKIAQTAPSLIIAHSFGGYFALNLEQDIPLFLIFPFLGNPSLVGKLTLSAASLLQKSRALSLFPHFLKKTTELFIPEVAYLEQTELKDGLQIAMIENIVLRNKLHKVNLKNRSRSKLIFNPSDRWSTLRTTKLLEPCMEVEETSAHHDFILEFDHRALLTEIFLRFRRQQDQPH